jgi:Fe-S cluster assembly protein SufD
LIGLGDMRQKAMDTFVEVGLPGPRVEEWKYTNLSSMNSKTYNTLNNTDNVDASIQSKIADTYINDIDGSKVVFVDGYFQSDLSDIKKEEGLILSSLSDYIKSHGDDAKALLNVTREETSLTYLNSALMTDGYVINVKQGIKLSQPIQIIHVA